MSEYKSEWTDIVKTGTLEGSSFTEEMKWSILERVDRPKRRPLLRIQRIMPVAILACMIFGLFFANGKMNDDLAGKPSNGAGGAEGAVQVEEIDHGGAVNAQYPVNYQVLEARSLKFGETIHLADPNILPNLTNKYSPLREPVHGYIEEKLLADVIVLDQKELEGFGTLIKYRLPGDEEKTFDDGTILDYFGFVVEGVSKPGYVFHAFYGNLYDDEISMTRVFGQSTLKIQNQCAKNGEWCTYYVNKDEGKMKHYLNFNSKVSEQDLDGDGIEEAISSTLIGNQIYLLKEKDGKLEWASVRDALGLSEEEVISYSESTGSFFVQSPSEEQPDKQYRYAQGSHELVLVEQALE